MITKRWLTSTIAVAGFAGLVGHAAADSTTFAASGSRPGGVAISASATFEILSDELRIVLQNTAPSNSGQDVPGSTLTGVLSTYPIVSY